IESRAVSEDRREAILKAAFDVLCEQGLPFVSNDVIAQRSGASRQLIRYYFAEKEDLMIALCDMMAEAYRDALVGLALNAKAPDRLSKMLDFYFDMLDGSPKPRDDKVYDAMLSLSAGSEAVRGSLRAGYSLLGNVVSHEISVDYPTMPVQDANQLSYLFVCLMYGHWKMVASLGFAEEHKTVTRTAVDRLIASYVATPSERVDQTKIWSRT
ncbi:MAG: TetR/AcrR family transcriptional regulator, partial [Sulfitobacter sp.]